jgi:hypothetical protein
VHNNRTPRLLSHIPALCCLPCVQVLHHRLQQGAAAGEAGFILDGFPRYCNPLTTVFNCGVCHCGGAMYKASIRDTCEHARNEQVHSTLMYRSSAVVWYCRDCTG